MKIAVLVLLLIVIAMVAYAVIDARKERRRAAEVEKKCDGKLIFGWLD